MDPHEQTALDAAEAIAEAGRLAGEAYDATAAQSGTEAVHAYDVANLRAAVAALDEAVRQLKGSVDRHTDKFSVCRFDVRTVEAAFHYLETEVNIMEKRT
jgi:hypothetical protein